MVILETFGNISSLLDIVLVIITIIGVFYGLKVKFVGEAKKAALEVEKLVKELEKAVMFNSKRMDDLEMHFNINSNDIATLKERTRHI